MGASLGLLLHQHLLTLFLGEPRLEDRSLVAGSGGDAELGSVAIKQIGGDGIGRTADAIELAPGERLDRARLLRGGMALEQGDIGGGGLLRLDARDRLIDGRRGRGWWRRRRLGRSGRGLARGIGRRDAMIGAIEIVKLRPGSARGHNRQCGTGHQLKDRTTMHWRHHSAASPAPLIALAAALALSACGDLGGLLPQGPLGALIDRAPPPIAVQATASYPNPLAEPVPPVITMAVADAVVGETLRLSLTPDGRVSLAQASMRAAAAATGAAVAWQAAGPEGAPVLAGSVVPVRDVYLSHRGHVCRDLQQMVQGPDRPQVEQVTLCREDLGDNRVLWLPGTPD